MKMKVKKTGWKIQTAQNRAVMKNKNIKKTRKTKLNY